MIAGKGQTQGVLSKGDVYVIAAEAFSQIRVDDKRVLVIIPDSTRTAPMGMLFRMFAEHIGRRVRKLDFLIALGTHPAMPEQKICEHLEITPAERASTFEKIGIFNHRWDVPDQLKLVGTISADQVKEISSGLLNESIPVVLNKMIFDYDQIIICGPVFPHEVVGFSGGNKYFFPGIAANNIIHFSHWLGALITNPKINGNKHTPVRALINRAASLINVEKHCFAFVVKGHDLAGLYVGAPEEAWSAAADLSAQLHVIYEDRPYKTVLSCAPPMYDDIWTAGKCMYKLEPVVADGGELIIYAPHIDEVSYSHGKILDQVGYHIRDYFLHGWDRYRHYPWGVLAHSTHVRGIGTCTNGVERPRITVTLATRIPEARCRKISLNYRDPASINVDDYKNHEGEGILYLPKAGEMLYRLKDPPAWQKG
jgi:lactate racemase